MPSKKRNVVQQFFVRFNLLKFFLSNSRTAAVVKATIGDRINDVKTVRACVVGRGLVSGHFEQYD